MTLTEEQLKTLNFFAKYLKLKKANVVKKNVYIDWDGHPEEDFVEQDWYITDTNKKVESIEDIDNLIYEILNNNDEIIDLFSENGGYLDVYFYADERVVQFVGEVNTIDSRVVDSGIDEIEESSKLWEWFQEMRNDGYEKAEVLYQGGGDSGYVESNMEVVRLGSSDTKSLPTPEFVATYIESDTEYNWWDNEGGQGRYNFDFVDETIEKEQEENYDSTEEIKIPFEIKF